jgi:hypothetical protein
MLRPVARALLVCLFAACTALPQDTSGRITGIISDPSGAVVPGAAVIARNVGTNGQTTALANSAGSYVFQSLVPGTYAITCEVPGFSRSVATGVLVQAENTTTLNITLTVGRTGESVTVAASDSQVETDNSTIQTTLGSQQISSLPVLGRNARGTIEQLQPGAVALGGRDAPVSYNGNRASTNNYRVDGGDVNNYFNGNQNENTTFPQPENLQEFSVITNANDAKYGTSSGAYITAVIKSGTNDLHGAGWGYLQNQGWAANNWESNRTGTPRPPGSQKWLGFNVGGPVWIPKLYNGRNKTFFFFSYEYTNPSVFTVNSQILPTAAERAGHFAGGAFPCPTLNGVKTCDVNPASFSPLAKAVLNSGLLPLSPDPTGLFSWTSTRSLKTDAYVGKIDQLIKDNHRVSFTITRNFQDPQSNDYGSCCGLPGNLPGLSTITNPHHITNYFFNYVWTVTPNIVNTLAVGGAHTEVTVIPGKINSNVNWQALGVNGVVPDRTALPTDVHIFDNSWGSLAQFAIFNGYYDTRTSNTTNIADDFVWIKGRHTLEAGYNQRIQSQKKLGNYDGAGDVSYSLGNTGSTGNGWADFFLDQGATYSQQSVEDTNFKYPNVSAYFQDRWKVSRKLTATLGLRWDPNQGYYEANYHVSEYRAGEKSTVYPNAPVGLVFYGDPNVPRAGYNSKWANFNPRVGLAYDLLGNGKMAFRAAYGVFSDFMTAQDNVLNVDLPFKENYSSNNAHPGQYRITGDPYFGQTGLFPFVPPAPGSDAAKAYLFPSGPQNIQGYDPNFNSGRIHQWNANFQWQPFSNWVFTTAYVGNRGTHLYSRDDLNSPIFIPYLSTQANAQFRRPDQNFGSIAWRTSGTNSRYNALQVIANKRYSYGLSLLANYTFGQSTADCASLSGESGISGCRDVRNKSIDYGPTPQDVRHVASFSYDYQLPFFQKSANHFVKTAVAGWVVGGITHAQSGSPLAIGNAAGFNDGSAGAYGNYVGGNPYGDHSSVGTSAANWLNRGAFCAANQNFTNGACVTDPTAGITHLAYGNTKLGFVRGPGRINTDLTLSKNFLISERWGSLEFRAAAFNVFNHTQLGNPDTSLDGSTFGQITSAFDPRQLQLSLRYRF